jgi:thymidylate synthase
MADLVPGELIMSFGDVHLYTDHLEQIKEQLSRAPVCPPVLQIHESVRDKMFEELSIEDFELIEYNSHPSIRAKMSV